MNVEERVRDAHSVEELDELQPPMDDYDSLSEWADASTEWYNEAVWTAARIFVEAAEESDKFREDFIADVQKEKTVEWGDDDTTIEVDAWRDTMRSEVPEYHERLHSIGLSAFQGGSAEQTARSVLEGDDE